MSWSISSPATGGATVAAQVYKYLLLDQEGNSFSAGSKPVPAGPLQFVEQLAADHGGGSAELVQYLLKFTADEMYRTNDDSHIHLLAACTHSSDMATRLAAYAAVTLVCRTGQQLLTYACHAQHLSELLPTGGTGWGRAQRKAISSWYNDRDPMQLLVTCTRFPTWNGWRHQDVLRLAHVKPTGKGTAVVIQYLKKGFEETQKEFGSEDAADDIKKILEFIQALEKLKHTQDEQEASFLIRNHKFEIDHTPTKLRKKSELWLSLLPETPLNKILLHLRRFAQLGFLSPHSPVLPIILEQLHDQEKLSASNIHPIDVFLALKKYEDPGRKLTPGQPKRRLTTSVIDALQNMFVSSLKNVRATGKHILIAVDVRNPMVHGRVQGTNSNLTPALASALLILPLLYVEENVTVAAFSMHGFNVLNLTKEMSLLDITKCMRETPMGPIDCAQPMLWAKQNLKTYDLFLILTDKQVNTVVVKPSDALKEYRKALNKPDARLIVNGLAVRRFTLASPDDLGMLDIGGFDMHVPRVISSFLMLPHN